MKERAFLRVRVFNLLANCRCENITNNNIIEDDDDDDGHGDKMMMMMMMIMMMILMCIRSVAESVCVGLCKNTEQSIINRHLGPVI